MKTFPIVIEVEALECHNSDFPLNTHAIELIAEMIHDAKSHCHRIITQRLVENNSNDEDDLIKYLEGKIMAYESMEKSLIKNQNT